MLRPEIAASNGIIYPIGRVMMSDKDLNITGILKADPRFSTLYKALEMAGLLAPLDAGEQKFALLSFRSRSPLQPHLHLIAFANDLCKQRDLLTFCHASSIATQQLALSRSWRPPTPPSKLCPKPHSPSCWPLRLI